MELIVPKNIFDKFFRWIGIVKSIDVINESKCNLYNVESKIYIKPGESKRVPISYNRISLNMFMDHKWYVLYKKYHVDINYDIIIDNRHMNFVDRNI